MLSQHALFAASAAADASSSPMAAPILIAFDFIDTPCVIEMGWVGILFNPGASIFHQAVRAAPACQARGTEPAPEPA
jgi:hypothetical protein